MGAIKIDKKLDYITANDLVTPNLVACRQMSSLLVLFITFLDADIPEPIQKLWDRIDTNYEKEKICND